MSTWSQLNSQSKSQTDFSFDMSSTTQAPESTVDIEELLAGEGVDEEIEEEIEEVEEEFEEELEEELDDTDNVTEEEKDAPAKSTPAKPVSNKVAPGKVTPGKVTPSKDVAKLKMKTPSSVASPIPSPQLKSGLKPDKNPFPAYAEWNAADMEAIKISFPILSAKNETTNDLTRRSKPEARYWRAPITFSYGAFTSTTMKFSNVSVPYHTGSKYGTDYLYICLPKYVGDAFASAGKAVAPTRSTEVSLVPDNNRWWKILNNVTGKVGIVDPATKKFMPKSLDTIFTQSNAGMTLSMVLSFNCKASTGESSNITASTMRTISVELVRGFIEKIEQNIEGPMRVVANKKSAHVPQATKADVASDDLLQRLSKLGL